MENEDAAPEGDKPDDAPLFHARGRSAGADRLSLSSLALEEVARIDRDIARAQERRTAVLDAARKLAESAAEVVVLDSESKTPARVDELGFRAFVAEAAVMMRVPESTMRTQIEEATTLQRDLPQTRAALAVGDISHHHARRIVDQSWSLPRDAAAGFEAAVVPRAKTQTPAQFSRTARVTREKMHPESIVVRRKRAEDGRNVTYQPLHDGMASVELVHTADVATAIYNATMETARGLQAAGETRSLPQIAADVFADATVSGFIDPRPGVDTPPLTPEAPSNDEQQDEGGPNEANGARESITVMRGIDAVRMRGSVFYTRPPRRRNEISAWRREQRKRHRKQRRSEGLPVSVDPDNGSLSQGTAAEEVTFDRALRLAVAERRRAGGVELDTNESIAEVLLHDVVTSARAHVRACRVDVFAGRGLRSALGVGDRRRSIRPTVLVTVPVLSLLDQTSDAANLDGYGPIDPEMAKALAANAPSFSRLLTHPETGAVMSVGRDSYRVPADLARALHVRDSTCRFPGCNRKAVWCDIDHTEDWQYGGETKISNLAYFCRKHHTLKHSTLWSAEQDAEGRLTWTSPMGNTFVTEPDVALARQRTGPSDDGLPSGDDRPREDPPRDGPTRDGSPSPESHREESLEASPEYEDDDPPF
ncbi:HNH endonuclease signature motif containing protein [Microbacterium sp. MPKO10]|uniref:HNH endonuclease signature motif containing protein n=1 Tax=Microbacterium sp. MPKO10 TaxID=2989818 RepID=UPI002235BDA3|nr:HNH endonuclease signature motif containing protein [Microbacterium sp. MPKO10]MCW4457191.1 HNH endonuclease [Microbacterium sp. MPKO10]